MNFSCFAKLSRAAGLIYVICADKWPEFTKLIIVLV